MRTTLILVCAVLLHTWPAMAASITFVDTRLDGSQVNFAIHFDTAPNLFTVDEFVRQQDALQVYIFNEPYPWLTPTFREPDLISIARGGEIYLGNGIPIRGPGPSDNNGGWGETRGTVPVTLNGSVLTYTTSLETLNVRQGFGYAWESFHFGVTNAGRYDCIGGQGCPSVPLPSMLWPTLVGFISLALIRARRV
jgi:hypothetical protein